MEVLLDSIIGRHSALGTPIGTQVVGDGRSFEQLAIVLNTVLALPAGAFEGHPP